MVKSVAIQGSKVTVEVFLTIKACPMQDNIMSRVRAAVFEIEGVEDVDVRLDVMNDEQRSALREKLTGPNKGIPFADPTSTTKIYAIASGKGGVGKSSLTDNLAVAMAQQGYSVGIIDADVYGHSIPGILGLTSTATFVDKDLRMPPQAHGVKALSMLSFKPGGKPEPVAFRGPMLAKVLEQFLSDFYWGDLDVLLLDLPPGTGDIAISTAQLLPNAQLVIVTTPQDIALLDARKGVAMFDKVGVPILGVVENMAMHVCTNCGHVEHIFGEDGGKRYAAEKGIDYLGALPLNMQIRLQADTGKPTVVSDPDGDVAGIYKAVARQVAIKVAAKAKDFSSKFPSIKISKDT